MLVRYLHGACYEIGTPSTSDIYLASFDHIWAGTVSEQRFENDSGSFAGGINFYRKRSVLQPDIFILPVHCIYGRICSKQIQKEEHEFIYIVTRDKHGSRRLTGFRKPISSCKRILPVSITWACGGAGTPASFLGNMGRPMHCIRVGDCIHHFFNHVHFA